MTAPSVLYLLAIIALALYIVFGYLFRKTPDVAALVLAVAIILIIVVLWFLPVHVT